MARILLGVSGGIAAYKALELVRLATAAGHALRVIQTPASQRFIGAASFAALTGAPVLTDEFERDPARGAFPDQPPPAHEPLSHLELVRNADILVVAPASANTIAKLAAGLADNLLTNAALAATCPLLVAPAMNNNMWAHPATQANVATLRARGAIVLEPGSGRLASQGEQGPGRLPEPATLLEAIEALTRPSAAAPLPALVGLRVLVTAGGTREPIDAVRFVGNRSSGRMGFALASEAAALGAAVTVVAANVALPRDARATYVDVVTAAELQAACAEAFPDADVLLMAAAVADYRPARSFAGKLKKAGEERLRVELERTPDILSGLAAARRPDQTRRRLRRRARRGRGRLRAREARPQAPRRGRRQRRLARGHRLRRPRQRGHDPHRGGRVAHLAGLEVRDRARRARRRRRAARRHGRARAGRLIAAARRAAYPRIMPSDDVYELFQNGTRLLEGHDFHAAAVPLRRARDLEPDKTSIREALGRALFGSQRYAEAVAEFEAIVERAPTNDYALFCLGRSLQQLGRHEEAQQAARARLLPAAGAQGLPPVPRSLARPRRVETARSQRGRTPRSEDGAGAILERQLSLRLRAGGRTGSGRSPAFFVVVRRWR